MYNHNVQSEFYMTDTAYSKSDNRILGPRFGGTQDLGLLKWDPVPGTPKYSSATLDMGPVTPYFISLEIIVFFLPNTYSNIKTGPMCRT